MAQQVTIKPAGLFLAPNDLGSVPDGALAQADDVVISREGVIEPRRGLDRVSTKALARLFAFKAALVGWGSTAGGFLSRSTDSGVTWTDYSGAYPATTGGRVRFVESSGNGYFTTNTGPYRLDGLTGTPEPAGVAGGLDVQASLAAQGTAMPISNQVAYRTVWGKRDANGNLLLGAPSGRTTVVNLDPYHVAIGSLVRSGSTVTATITTPHVLIAGDTATLSPGETNFDAGVKTITAVTASTFSYSEAGSAVSSTAVETFTGPSKDVTITGSIPQVLPAGAFFQVYRSPNTNSATVTPNDELGLVYEGIPPAAATLSGLSRTGFVVTATTVADHGYLAGMTVRLASSAGTAGPIVAVGASVAATSADSGATWTNQAGIPAKTFNGVAWSGTVFCACADSVGGVGGFATSPDGVTWTTRSVAGTATYSGICWNGSLFVAVGPSSACATSTDGTTWTPRTITGGNWSSVAWGAGLFVAVGDNNGGYQASTSPDGVTWTGRYISTWISNSNVWSTITFGDRFVVVGSHFSMKNYPVSATSSDGITWTGSVHALGVPDGNSLAGLAYNGVSYVTSLYGTASVARSGDGLTWSVAAAGIGPPFNGLIYTGAEFISVPFVSGSAATSPDGITWTARTIPAGAFRGLASGGARFGSGDRVIGTAPTPTTFTYSEFGLSGSASSSQVVTPSTFVFVDNVPSGFLGAALYTNPNQGTISASADRVMRCQDLAIFRGYMFAANITYPSTASFYLLSVGGTGGVQAGDFITIDGTSYAASTSAESAAAGTFLLYTSGTPSQNIEATAQSLIRVLNRTSTNNVLARYLSGPDDPPGLIYVEEDDLSTTMALSFSRPTVWSIQGQKGVENRKNELRWSSSGQPDAMPLLNFSAVGSKDRTIQRIVPTRDMLVIVKDDGLWRLTGWNGIWDIQPLDPTMGTPCSESLVAFENAMFGLLDSGGARATESGVEMITTPIYNAIEPMIAPATSATLESVGFGIAYHSSHKYMLWLPASPSATAATQAYVYDSWTNAWTRWTAPTFLTSGWLHGLVNPADDRLYMADGTYVYQERKALTSADLQDTPSGGSFFWPTIQFAPKFGGNPGALHHFREVTFVFRQVQFTSATVYFSTNVSPAEESVVLNGSDYGIASAPGNQVTIRVLVPLEKARATQLNVRISIPAAGIPFQLQGLSVVYRSTSTRVGR